MAPRQSQNRSCSKQALEALLFVASATSAGRLGLGQVFSKSPVIHRPAPMQRVNRWRPASHAAEQMGIPDAIALADKRREGILDATEPGASDVPADSTRNRTGPQQGKGRWRRFGLQPEAPRNVESTAVRHPAPAVGWQLPNPSASPSSTGDRGHAVWLLGRRCVEMCLPSGSVACHELPLDVKPGSRAVANPQRQRELFILGSKCSRVWRFGLASSSAVELTESQGEGARFASSLGSRLVWCPKDGGEGYLLATGTPGKGAHTPWLFDIDARTWHRLPDAPHPILSSAVAADTNTVTIAGGWSKARSCHGFVQVLTLSPSPTWRVLSRKPIPWRRPGAGGFVDGQLLLALGWIECQGTIGTSTFRFLPRNGATQGARTSSSRLCVWPSASSMVAPELQTSRTTGGFGEAGQRLAELSVMPFADSFENSGDLFRYGTDEVLCIGRDHLQAFHLTRRTWQTWQLPRELSCDSSNSWVKHCGSWAVAWLP